MLQRRQFWFLLLVMAILIAWITINSNAQKTASGEFEGLLILAAATAVLACLFFVKRRIARSVLNGRQNDGAIQLGQGAGEHQTPLTDQQSEDVIARKRGFRRFMVGESILVVVAILIGAVLYESHWRAIGRQEAEHDIEDGAMKYRIYGYMAGLGPKDVAHADLMRRQFNVEVTTVAQCVVTTELVERAGGYNARIAEELEAKFGPEALSHIYFGPASWYEKTPERWGLLAVVIVSAVTAMWWFFRRTTTPAHQG